MINDVAILKLKTPLKFEIGVVQRACLPGPSFEPKDGESSVSSGWGLMHGSPKPKLPDTLQVCTQKDFHIFHV